MNMGMRWRFGSARLARSPLLQCPLLYEDGGYLYDVVDGENGDDPPAALIRYWRYRCAIGVDRVRWSRCSRWFWRGWLRRLDCASSAVRSSISGSTSDTDARVMLPTIRARGPG